ncbi:hypothetical protein BKA83DRAFT_490802 [Pisolithus microcarpus]|nr:hypothetical protein BKA83DRAFT_490802 [Pisolithus microcarpus]
MVRSAENALGCLLVEIISQSGDISVLNWVGEASSFHNCFPVDLVPYRMTPPTRSKPRDHAGRNSLARDGFPFPSSSCCRSPCYSVGMPAPETGPTTHWERVGDEQGGKLVIGRGGHAQWAVRRVVMERRACSEMV